MGKLLDDIAAANQQQVRRRYRVEEVADSLDPADRDDFLAAADDPSVRVGVLHEVMARRGITISTSAIRTWRSRPR